MTAYTPDRTITDEVCTRLGINTELILSLRTFHILAHYQRTWDRSRHKSPLYLDHLVHACIANLAGANETSNPDNRPVRL